MQPINTTLTSKTDSNSSNTRAHRSSLGHLVLVLIAAFALLGSTATVVSAQPDDLVSCIPTEFEPCPEVDDPAEPGPFVVVGDLTFCDLDENGQNPCPTPDPEPVTPFDGPGDLTFCDLDQNGQNPCPDPDPENPFEGPGDLTDCGLDDDGQNPCPNPDPGGEGEGEGGEGEEGGIDDPVTGDPDFTG